MVKITEYENSSINETQVEEDVEEDTMSDGETTLGLTTDTRTSAGAVVMQQPGIAAVGMVAPPPGCPPGLEYLSAVNKIIVEQLVEMMEVFTGIECRNKYKICNALGQQVYFAGENSACCNRSIAKSDRAFVMNIVDNAGREVARVIAPQPLKIICKGRVADVEAPPGNKVGSIRQTHGCCGRDFHICDHTDAPIYYLSTPCCACGNIEFPVTSLANPVKIGAITKYKGDFLKEMFTNADTFGVDFPINLDPRMKITLIGATFLVDFMYFEDKQNNKSMEGRAMGAMF